MAEAKEQKITESISHEISQKSLAKLCRTNEIDSFAERLPASLRQQISLESFLKNMTLEEGTNTKFICSVKGPITSVIWTKDGSVIDGNSRYEPGRNDGLVYLEIKNTVPSDSGMYAVNVSNNLNEMSSNAQLNVYPNQKQKGKDANQQSLNKGK